MNNSRRSFIKGAGIFGGALLTGNSVALAQEDSSKKDKVNLAVIGLCTQGSGDLALFMSSGLANLVALCDVDDVTSAGVRSQYPNVPFFKDFRVMLDKMDKNIDAVLIATPDHTHYPIAMRCMAMGKHVYVEKPMARTPVQIRRMAQFAKENNIITQMGNQFHSSEFIRLAVEWIQAGAIGEVKELQAWHDWPDLSNTHWYAKKPVITENPPDTLDWENWLGPVPYTQYSKSYTPRTWRSFFDFGTGILGDWGCHTFDVINWAMKLCPPESVELLELIESPIKGEQCYHSKVRWNFPARGDLKAISLTWCDGFRNSPTRPAGSKNFNWEDKKKEHGALFIGEKGDIYLPGHPASIDVFPSELFADIKKNPPAKILPRIKEGHYANFLNCVLTGEQPTSNFEYAATLTEIVMLGVAAQRAGMSFKWDAVNCRADSDKVNSFLNEPVRQGWNF